MNNKVSHSELGYRRGVYGVEERGVFVVGVTVMESEAVVDTAKLMLSSCMVCDSFFLFLALNFVRFIACICVPPFAVARLEGRST